MGRTRSYDTETVIAAARDLFWERGYEGADIADLEASTGINRSSLYHAFGSKRGLFDAVLDRYLTCNIGELLKGMRQPDSGLDDVISFFRTLADVMRRDPRPLGCLMVNSATELANHDPGVAERAQDYRDLLRRSFKHALSADRRPHVRPAAVERRASLLASATMGVFVSARIDPIDAAELCDALAAEVRSWK